MTSPLLIGIDLEDVRSSLPDPNVYRERVPDMVQRYLTFFDRAQMKTTFFTVGDIARRYPALVREIVSAGHEIACHTNEHIPLDRQSPSDFRDDLTAALEALDHAGAKKVTGFRAPVLSLTNKTSWAYQVLSELGFSYSSSVLPRKNPLYGWEDFGDVPRQFGSVWEFPVSILPGLGIPFAAGVYFRALPSPVIQQAARSAPGPIVGYLHPYDIDTEQERFMHPGINGSRFYNWLMYYNRGSVLSKLARLVEAGFRTERYCDFVGRSFSNVAAARA